MQERMVVGSATIGTVSLVRVKYDTRMVYWSPQASEIAMVNLHLDAFIAHGQTVKFLPRLLDPRFYNLLTHLLYSSS